MEFSRADRLQSQLVKEITGIIENELHDRPPGLVTITRSEISRDLRHAKVFFTVLAEDALIDKTLEFLKRHVNVIRRLVSGRMRIKHVPEIYFQYDSGSENTLRILSILEKIKNEDGQKSNN